MVYTGVVTRTQGPMLYVRATKIAGDIEIGPYPAVEAYRWEGDTLVVGYEIGDPVIIARFGSSQRFVIIGRRM